MARITLKFIAGQLNNLTKAVDNLAHSTKIGVDDIYRRFDGIDNRLDKHDQKFETLQNDNLNINLRLDQTATKFDLKELEKRISKQNYSHK